MKYVIMMVGVCFLVGCGYLPSGVAKQSDLEVERKRTDVLERGLKDARKVLSEFSEENAAKTEELHNRTRALEGNVAGLQAGVATLNTQMASKVDVAQLDASIAAWARQQQFATAQQLGGVQSQVGKIGQQVAGKMDRFRVEPVRPSTAVTGAMCMHFLDRQTAQWYCWRWQTSDPANSTVLLKFQPKQCPCGNCGTWQEIPVQQGLEMLNRENLPVPDHMLNFTGGGNNPELGPTPLPP